jgi:CCR4-NOT transcription complex subunit 1
MGSDGLHAEVQRAALVCLRDLCPKVIKELTNWLLFSEDERKMNRSVVFGLIQQGLINVKEYAMALAKLMDNGRSAPAVDFTKTLVRSLVIEKKVVPSAELAPVLDVLNSLAQYGEQPNQELTKLLEEVRAAQAGPGSRERRRLRERPVRNDKERQGIPPGLPEKVLALFEEWLEIC